MASERKFTLMLMDNASSHGIPSLASEKIQGLNAIRLSNVLIVFLPANTSKVQPLNAGIIAAFEQHYRTHLMRWYLSEYEAAEDEEEEEGEEEEESTNLSKVMPGVRQAILWSIASMDQILSPDHPRLLAQDRHSATDHGT